MLVLSLWVFIAGRRLSGLVDWALGVAHCGVVFVAQAVVGNLVSAMFSSQRQLDLWRKQSAVSGAAAAGAEIEEDGDGEAVAARVWRIPSGHDPLPLLSKHRLFSLCARPPALPPPSLPHSPVVLVPVFTFFLY